MDEEDDYGDIADEDLIEAFTQASQTLPPLSFSPRVRKRSRINEGNEDGIEVTRRQQHESPDYIENDSSSNEEGGSSKKKKLKYKIHVTDRDVPAAQFLGATQAEALPDSSPYRIRGPIYKRPRPEPEPECGDTISQQFLAPRQHLASRHRTVQEHLNKPIQTINFDHEFEDLPSDVISSPEKDAAPRAPSLFSSSFGSTQGHSFPSQRLVAPQQGLRQTTLFGGRATEVVSASQTKKVHNFKVDKSPELPTHHLLNDEALKTWVYPTNLGAIRNYQYGIVKNGLFNNLLVALPTGLGKTFIAATVMLNFFRWTTNSQIVFVAPTKPLVAQQVDACFNIVGIPKSQTTMLTGEQAPGLRAEEWDSKRVFFMTPQTLNNDLASGIADPKKIVLLVVDEAHRATGNYSYVSVVSFLRRFNKSFRILALTATPGATVESVQEIIDNLEISKVEIRTEDSLDIQQYVHGRNIDQILLDPSDEIIMVKELFGKALQPLLNQLCTQNAYWNKDPMSITTFGMMQARSNWMKSDAGRRANPGLKGMMNGLFSILASVAHGIKLLNFHGIGPFYSAIKEFRQGVEDSNKPGKYRNQIVQNSDFKKMMDRIGLWLSKDDFVGHPKMTYLCDTILNHFLDAGEGRLGEDAPPSSTRVIVFAEFRDSAEDIARVLNRHGPMIRASVFVGQADSKRSEGMNQAKQHETIANFKSGKFNVIVATSIGEEGLDIGQVDLIVCYDSSSSPIRMLQRMGRTGRKRAGNIVLLLMRGKEEESFTKAKDNYEQMQKMISDGQRFNFRHDLSVRIVPKGIIPIVDKRVIDIPIENTQGPSLPEPKRRAAKTKKKPPKKFHMPDGVSTGFRKASNLSDIGAVTSNYELTVKTAGLSKDQIVSIPPLEAVLLNKSDEDELERRYQNVVGNDMQEVSMPDLTAQTVSQRSLGPVVRVKHGQYTRRCVGLFKNLADSQSPKDRHIWPYGEEEPLLNFWPMFDLVEDERVVPIRKETAPAKQKQTLKPHAVPIKKKQTRKPKPTLLLSDVESDGTPSDEAQMGHEMRRQGSSSISGDESEGEGDDLLNSEEPSEESDDGEDLRDFIAGTDETIFGTGEQPPTSSLVTPLARKEQDFVFEDSQSTHIHSFDTDDSLPDVSQLVDTMTELAPTRSFGCDSDDIVPPAIGRRERRRRVVEESDSDE